MRMHYLYQVKEDSTVEETLLELTPYLEDIYEMQDPEGENALIGGYADDPLPNLLHHCVLIESASVEEIDWTAQWATFATDFRDGLAHIDLPIPGAPQLLLKPGGGFGDLSHPTTRLVLSLMSTRVANKTVFDIGCGSGILTIAAILLGADKAIGIDIDKDALKHSMENAALNTVSERALFTEDISPELLPKEPYVILMNMIASEQLAAWPAHPALHSLPATLITSGILTAAKKTYLDQAKQWGWTLLEEKSEGEWSAFVFSK